MLGSLERGGIGVNAVKTDEMFQAWCLRIGTVAAVFHSTGAAPMMTVWFTMAVMVCVRKLSPSSKGVSDEHFGPAAQSLLLDRERSTIPSREKSSVPETKGIV